LKRLLQYILGFVVIHIQGHNVERFLNLASHRGISIWDIYWIDPNTVRAKVILSGIKPLRHVARISRCRFQIRKKTGVPFIIRYFCRRKMLALGAVIFVMALYLLSSFIFFIDVSSPEPLKNVNPQMVKRLAAEKGIIVGRPKWMMDFKETEKYLINKIPYLTWVGIHTKGTRIEIEIVEKILPDPGEKDKTPGNIVALKDGVIKEILVMKGQPLVSPGDTVAKGEVLISGIIQPEAVSEADQSDISHGNQGEKVRADGIVRARVWYSGYGEWPEVETGKRSTGKEMQKIMVAWKNKSITLWGPEKSPYQLSISSSRKREFHLGRNISLPVEVVIITYKEQETYQKIWGTEGALNKAAQAALQAAKRQIPPLAQVVSQEIKPVENSTPGLKRAYVLIETEEDIGKLYPIE